MILTTVQKWNVLGLCLSCGGVRDNHTTRCTSCKTKHGEQNRLRHRSLAAERKEQGLCTHCGKPVTGASRCPDCAAKHAESNKKSQKSRTSSWDKAGLCIQCGSPRDNDTKRCTACQVQHNLETAEGNKARLAQRAADGVCTGCGGPRDQTHTKMCTKCLREYASRNYRSRAIANEKVGVCRRCSRPVISTEAGVCAYHFAYAILHNFMGAVPSTTVEAVAAKLEAQEFKCALTGVPLVPGKNASLDHVLPRTKYPELATELTNLIWVDHAVNVMKQNITPEDRMLDVLFAPALVARIRELASKVIRPQ